jgi:hypothetical protein
MPLTSGEWVVSASPLHMQLFGLLLSTQLTNHTCLLCVLRVPVTDEALIVYTRHHRRALPAPFGGTPCDMPPRSR